MLIRTAPIPGVYPPPPPYIVYMYYYCVFIYFFYPPYRFLQSHVYTICVYIASPTDGIGIIIMKKKMIRVYLCFDEGSMDIMRSFYKKKNIIKKCLRYTLMYTFGPRFFSSVHKIFTIFLMIFVWGL